MLQQLHRYIFRIGAVQYHISSYIFLLWQISFFAKKDTFGVNSKELNSSVIVATVWFLP